MAADEQSGGRDKARIEMDPERLESHAQRAKDAIQNDQKIVPPFWINKYKKDASRNWDIFYKRNTTKFFKGTFKEIRTWLEWSFKKKLKKDMIASECSLTYWNLSSTDRYWLDREFEELAHKSESSEKKVGIWLLYEWGVCPGVNCILSAAIDLSRSWMWCWKFCFSYHCQKSQPLHIRLRFFIQSYRNGQSKLEYSGKKGFVAYTYCSSC